MRVRCVILTPFLLGKGGVRLLIARPRLLPERRRGGEVYAGRTDAGEVDFVVMRHNGERAYYQVAYTANDENILNRELSSLRKIKDAYPKYLLTTDFDSANIDGIRKINVIDWLLGSKSN